MDKAPDGAEKDEADRRLRGRPPGTPRPEFKTWVEGSWPSSCPAAGYGRARLSRSELHHIICEVIQANGAKPPHVKTIGNALNAWPISNELAVQIADAIGRIFPESPFAAPPIEVGVEPNVVINGEWEVFYVEDDLTQLPVLTRERAHVEQNGSLVTGRYECLSYDRPYPFVLSGTVNGRCFLGAYKVPDRRSANGWGSFQLLSGRHNEWLDGFCTWLDWDSGRVEGSRCLWYNRASVYAEIYARDATRIMDAEMDVWTRRRELLTRRA